jgi:hypothetical protein
MLSKIQTFGKLFRYECKALLRILPVLYLASLVLSAVAGLWFKENDVSNSGMINIALIVVTLVLIILRFRNNFLKDEGYLMFTLLVYACLTVSQIVPRFRGLIGVAVYLAVMLLVELPLSTLVNNTLAEGTLKLWITALGIAVFAVVYFIASVKLLKHTFNLE